MKGFLYKDMFRRNCVGFLNDGKEVVVIGQSGQAVHVDDIADIKKGVRI